MAKRKKLKNVVISNQELTPTTIGYLNEKDGGILFVIVAFGIFFAFLYFVPDINQYIEKLKGNDVNQNIPYIPDDPVVEEERQDDSGKEFDFNLDSKIVIGDLTFSKFSANVDTISLSVVNTSKEIVNCSEEEYYIILKNT